MRLVVGLASLCAGILFSHSAAAVEPLPQRWVSAGGSLSEWVVVLGGQDKLVGVDTTSQHPESLKALPSVGYQRQLAAEGILSLRPDILLGTEEMGPPPVLAQISAAGVRVERLASTADLATLEKNLTLIGTLLGAEARASKAIADYRQRLQRQADWVAKVQRTQQAPKVLFLLGHSGSSPLAAGKDTAATWLIERAGGRNLTDHQGYKAISNEALAALDPDVVVIADRRLEGDAAREALLKQNPALAATRAAREGRLLSVDPTLLVGGLGPRLPEGMAALARGFYPSAPALTEKSPSQP
ncbi:hemin ABC transporter substrate-binding protein [Metapseudomonas resinovorans]|uniref:Putative hemin ABC transporter substrate-binding protein n=1 Tax=Metapseudomonas resinovorans NBRC 106553 TaxID=1245471 RepID=S6AIV2_METRE|nr:ABC transporter substrate-binding protein [Pseudomonas resinovorans]BAN50607.1 putative hemin ABC transporter substrate-binding protein [Pseudomonas resinovorans NBRC 106553]